VQERKRNGYKKRGAVNLFFLDQASGNTLWTCEVYKGAVARQHKDNSLASSTPDVLDFEGFMFFMVAH